MQKNNKTNKTYKSFKLKKQASMFTLICDQNKIPVDHSIKPAYKINNVKKYTIIQIYNSIW